MKFENEKQLIESVKQLADSISIIHYHKQINPKKALVKKFGEIGEIEKRSIFQVRVGVNYEDVAVIKEKGETESDKSDKQPTMEKIGDGVYRNRFTQKLFIGSQPVDNDDFKPESNYYLNGEKVELDKIIVEDKTFADFLYAADLPKDNNDGREFQFLAIENIQKIL